MLVCGIKKISNSSPMMGCREANTDTLGQAPSDNSTASLPRSGSTLYAKTTLPEFMHIRE